MDGKGILLSDTTQISEKPEISGKQGTEKKTKNEWVVHVIEEIKGIEPSQFHPEKKWLATHFKVIRGDGKVEEIESTTTILEITNGTGEVIEVTAYVTYHIMSLHIKGQEAGSIIEGDSLEASMKLIAKHLPDKIPFKENIAAFEIDIEQQAGIEGVTSQQEMLESGVITEEDLDILSSAKDNVLHLNIEGSDEERQKFVQEFNLKLAGRKASLGIRGGAIIPFFETDKQSTTRMFIVISRTKDKEGKVHNNVITMAPGRYMDRLPTDVKFTGELDIEGINRGVSVAELWSKARKGDKLSPLELSILDEQKKAQECWWQGGFICPSE